MVDRTTVGGIARSLGILVEEGDRVRLNPHRVAELMNGADSAWSSEAVAALISSLDPAFTRSVEPPTVPTATMTDVRAMNGPIGVYHLQRAGQKKPAVKLAAFDDMLDVVLRWVPADALVVLSGLAVERLEESRHRARIAGASDGDKDLPAILNENRSLRVVILSGAPFSNVTTGSGTMATVHAEAINLRDEALYSARTEHPADHAQAEPSIVIQTYAELPALLGTYVAKMDRLWSALKLIDRFDPEDPKDRSVREGLIEHLRQVLDELDERRLEVDGLPAMNIEDLKLSVANLMTLARRESNAPKVVVDARRRIVRRAGQNVHDLRLVVDKLPPDLARRVDANNLLLAVAETEARCAVADRVGAALEGLVDGVYMLGSAAWGAHYGVKEASDIDMEVMVGDADLVAFESQLPHGDLANMSTSAAIEMMQRGHGRVFETIRALRDNELLVGVGEAERAKNAITTFGTFARLRKEDRGDYLSYKVQDDGVDVSLHVIPTEVFVSAATMNLVDNAETRHLREVRVGERKKVNADSRESVGVDFTTYPDKRSFEGGSLDHRCPVSALVADGENIVAIRPSDLASHGHREDDVRAWVTETPLTVVEHGRLFHGLFQDKALWGEFTQTRSPKLVEAKAQMISNLIDRFKFEVDEGLVSSRGASILKLSARLERIPAFTKRELLQRLRAEDPGAFMKLAGALASIGSKELESFGIEPLDPRASVDERTLNLPAAFAGRCRMMALRGLGRVADLTSKLDGLIGTKVTDKLQLPDAEIIFMVKPLGMQMGVEDRVRRLIEESGGSIVGAWTGTADTLRIAEHYRRHADKPVFGDMVSYFAGQEVTVLRARINTSKIAEVREQLGSYKPKPGSVRDALIGNRWKSLYRATGIVDNGLHISDSKAEGAREVAVWFEPPTIVSERPATQEAHAFLWRSLSAIDPSLQFAGSQYNGLAITTKKDDLDYRVLASDVDEAALKVADIEGMTFRREGIDAKCGERFLLYEYSWEGGKADVAVVPKEHYQSRVSAAVLANFLPDEWKGEVRDIKDQWRVHMEAAHRTDGHGSARYKRTKHRYERAKKAVYRTVKRYFGLSQKTGPVPDVPQAEIDVDAVSARLALVPRTQREGLENALAMLPEPIRTALLAHVLSFEIPEPPPGLKGALEAALAKDAKEQDELVSRHRDAYTTYAKPYETHKSGLDEIVAAVAANVKGTVVSAPLKGERRAISRAVLKGTTAIPNWSQVKDIVRTSVVCPDVQSVGRAVDETARAYGGHIKIELDRSGQIVKVPKDRFRRPVGGYYDYMLKVDFGEGRQGEVQFHLPEMIVAKLLGRGHEVYDRMRAVMRLCDDSEHGDAARAYFNKLDVQMRDYYGATMELARARHGETDMPFLDMSVPYIDRLIQLERKRRGQS